MQENSFSVAETPETTVPVSDVTFHDLGIAPQILKSLDYYGYKVPTPIQRDAIPVVATGVDVIGIAQTGTGKTMAFGIPAVQHLMLQGGQALILLPTRELALQVEESLIKICRPLHLNTVCLIGGESLGRQIGRIKQGVDIIVATPGRLNDHIRQGNIRLDKVRIAILDEADRMLDMGFEPQIRDIMREVPATRQTLLFSATMPEEIIKMVKTYQKEPVRVEVARAGENNDLITQELVIVPRSGKVLMLVDFLTKYEGSVLVFSRTKHGARQLTEQLNGRGIKAMEIHSNRSLQQRKQALEYFKTGRVRVLVATDIAARGIDVSGIELVVNYDLPDNPEDYVHRIGRTGRAGKLGHAVSFATPDQTKELRQIERLIQREIPNSDLSQAAMDVSVSGRGGRGPSQNRGAANQMRSPRRTPFNAPMQPRQESRPLRDSAPQQPRSDDSRSPIGPDRRERDRAERRDRNGKPQERRGESVFSAALDNVSAPKGFFGPRSTRNRRPQFKKR
jgi:ATP-dependent RNA helicase RhlE